MKSKESSSCDLSTFVGNRSLRCLDLKGPDGRTLREKYLIGEPQACPMGCAAEMKKSGYVGIYDKQPRRAVFPQRFTFAYARA
jgi:hypothetical protein